MDSLPPGAIPADQFEEGTSKPQSPEEIKALGLPEGTIPADQFQAQESETPTQSQFETPGQQLMTGAEGAAQGVLGPVATFAELGAHKVGLDTALGVDTSAEAMKGRKEANPVTHAGMQATALAASMFTGVGEAGLLAKGAGKIIPQASSVLGMIGSAAIKGALESGGIQAGDEISKAMIGQGDAEAPVSSALAHIGAAGLFGGTIGGAFNAAGQVGNKGLVAIENAKLGDRANGFLNGIGAAAKAREAGIPEKEAEEFITKLVPDLNYRDIKPGVDFYYKGAQHALGKIAGAGIASGIGGGIGTGVGHVLGAPIGSAVAGATTAAITKSMIPIVEKVLNKPLVGITNKIILPVIANALSKGQTSGLFNALNHAAQISKGAKAIGNGVDSILKSSSFKPVDMATDKAKDSIKEYINNGGVEKEMKDSMQAPNQPQEAFAEGGEVPSDIDEGSIASLYPDQNMLMNAAKGRISNYLTSLKPSDIPNKLPFDPPVDRTDAMKTYNNAVDVAAAPLSILNKIRDGSIKIEDVKHFTSLYPELHQHLSKKFTEGILNAQLGDEKLSYKKRIALSLFMGTALDSTMTPVAIQAAQTTYAPKQQPVPMQGGKKDKGNSAKLDKAAKSYKTADQSAESDRSDRK